MKAKRLMPLLLTVFMLLGCFGITVSAETFTIEPAKPVEGINFYKGDTIQLNANLPEEYQDAEVTWSVKKTGYVTVTETGLATLTRAATSSTSSDFLTVVATASKEGTEINAEYVLPKAQSISISGASAISKKVPFAEGTLTSTMSGVFSNLKWESQNPDIVSVDNEGNIKLLKTGSAYIGTVGTSPYGTEMSYYIKLNVRDYYLTGLSANRTYAVGNTVQVESEELKTYVSQDITWHSSDESIVEVDENGLLTMIKAGAADIWATAQKDGIEYKSQTKEVKVNDTVATVTVDDEIINAYSISDAVNKIPNNGTGTIRLLSDITISSYINIGSGKNVILELGEHTIYKPTYSSSSFSIAMIRVGGASLTINSTTGGMKAGDADTMGNYCLTAYDNGKIIINGGNYFGGLTCVQVEEGTAEINGGRYEVKSNDTYGHEFTLNCIDANYKDGTAIIKVNGGTFVNFNPSDNLAEGTDTNFVAEGHIVENVADGIYTVAADSEEDSSITFTNSESIQYSDGNLGGIRFIFNANIAESDEVNIFGAYILPFSIFESNTEDKTANSVNVQYNRTLTDGESFSADIVDIPAAKFSTDIYAIPYIIVNNTVTTFDGTSTTVDSANTAE